MSENRQIVNVTTENVAKNLVCFSEDTNVCREMHPYQVQLVRFWVNSITCHIRYLQISRSIHNAIWCTTCHIRYLQISHLIHNAIQCFDDSVGWATAMASGMYKSLLQ